MSEFLKLQAEIKNCDACSRLRRYCQKVAKTKRRAYMNEVYWGRPITGLGDPKARLMIVGLAPAAHGANRTGRIFTGDRSGDWLYRAMHRAGFANQPTSTHRQDGLELKDAYVTCAVKCAPPDNQPSLAEKKRCNTFLRREMASMPEVRVWIALGGIALAELWPLLAPLSPKGRPMARPKFAHGAQVEIPGKGWLLMSYHPSQQNTFTGRLTEPMFDSVFTQARRLITQ